MKVKNPFSKASLMLLQEVEYGRRVHHDQFEEMKDLITKSNKAFYLLGANGYSIDDCKKFLTEFDGATIDEFLEKVEGGEVIVEDDE